ncbi:MAG: glycerol kinase [Myxococcales bacterium]|nr:glycerol kinase [Myxococcales bacterium]
MILGIDQGTTGTRACLVAEDLTIQRSAYAAHAQHAPRPGWVEHDPAEIRACTRRVIAEVLAAGERPEAIAIANQGVTCLLWDARTGEPVHRALVWQDTRTEDRLAVLAPHAERIRALTGLRLDSYFSASKLAWLLDAVPGARARAAAGHLRAGTLDTWLVERLTGGRVFATDASTAARTLLCETVTCTWSDELCALFDVPRSLLPEIRDCDAGFGDHEGIPILASMVDQPAAMLGQGCVDAGDVKATFGTGCFVYANAGTTRPGGGRTLATVAWRRGGQTTYALDGGVLTVGAALAWVRSLGLPSQVAETGSGGGGNTVFVPALVGLGAPHWDRAARAAWLDLDASTSAEDLVAAVREGIACRAVEVIHAIERDAGVTVNVLRVDGGLARDRGLVQRVADLLGVPAEVAEEEEATVVGVAAMAALRLGRLGVDDLRARRARGQARVSPAITAAERAARLHRWQGALARARQWR